MSEPAEIAAGLEARVGTTLAGKYHLTRILGAGGMGAVFEAQNTWTERRVAIKVMTGARVHDDDVVARFLREARAAAKIDHPNIVDVLDMGQDPSDGTLYIVQEFLHGRDLRYLLDERSALRPREAFEYLAPIMAALVAAHDRGIVHRDLKPENIFITRTPSGTVPKLIDFGIAKVTDQGRPVAMLTRTGETMGTPYYMSPEQARGEKDIDAQTDVWAMGAVWFEALAGRCPFLGDSYNALLSQILMAPVPRLMELVPSLPPSLARAVHRALERDREARYGSMRLFLRALLECADLAGQDWHRSLREHYVSVVGSDEYDNEPTSVVALRGEVGEPKHATTERSGPPVDVMAASADAAALKAEPYFSTTMSRTSRVLERPASQRPPRRVGVWGTAGGVAAALLAVAVTAVVRGRDHEGEAVVRAPAAAPPSPLSFAIRVDPLVASIALDGQAVGQGVFAGSVPRDGRAHTLVFSAPGYEPQTLAFASEPPPSSVRLNPLAAPVVAPRLTPSVRETPTRPSLPRVGSTPSHAAVPGSAVGAAGAHDVGAASNGGGTGAASPTHGADLPVLRPHHAYP